MGIGTASPQKRLEVYENNASTTTTTGILIRNFSTTSNARAGVLFANFDNSASAIWSPRTGDTSGLLVFGTKVHTGNVGETDITERMRITPSGDLLVGASSNTFSGSMLLQRNANTTNLDVYAAGDATDNNIAKIRFYNNANNGAIGQAGNSLVFYNSSVTTERMRITSDGNVGIGTSSPAGAAGRNLTIYNSSGQSRLALKNSVTGDGANDGFQVGIDGDGIALVEQRENLAMSFSTNATERMRIRADGGILSQPTGGGTLLEQFGCRSWVNFNGQGTIAIRGSGNVSSIGDGGTGRYQVNFATAMPDANYSVVATCNNNEGTSFVGQIATGDGLVGTGSCFFFVTNEGNGLFDSRFVFVSVFR